MNSKLVKTALGRTEMRTRELGLPVLERRLLILSDGTRTLAQLQEMFAVPILEFAAKLQTMGLLELAGHSLLPAAIAPPLPQLAQTAEVPAVAATQPALLESDAYEIGVDLDLEAEAASVEDLASDFAEEKNSTWPDWAGEIHFKNDGQGDTQPGLLTHRAASPVGIIVGKAYLIETVEGMLAKDGAWLVRKISEAKTEAELYYALEQLVTTVSVFTSQSSVNSIIQRFEEKISQR